MAIDIISNAFVQQVSGVLKNRQVQNVDQNDDANVTATLQNAQNIGEKSTRKVEQGQEADSGASAKDGDELHKQHNEAGQLLDIVA